MTFCVGVKLFACGRLLLPLSLLLAKSSVATSTSGVTPTPSAATAIQIQMKGVARGSEALRSHSRSERRRAPSIFAKEQ